MNENWTDRKVARLISCCIFTSFCPAAQKQEGLYYYEGRELIYHDKPRPWSSDEAGDGQVPRSRSGTRPLVRAVVDRRRWWPREGKLDQRPAAGARPPDRPSYGLEALAGRWRLRLPPFQHAAGRGRSPDGARRRRGNWTGGGAELDEGPLSAGLKRI